MRHSINTLARRAVTLAIVAVICTGIGAGAAQGAPLLDDLLQDGNIIFSGPGVDGARDIRTSDNDGGLRFYNGSSLDVIPQGAAIQFFGNDRGTFNGQAFIDSGAHNNAAVIFRTAGTGQSILERMRVDAQGNVGIGTATPGEKLTVQGSQRIAGESNPVERGSVTSANLNGPFSVFVSGRYAYVAARASNRLVVVDVSNPAAPVEASSVTSANLNGPTSVYVSGRYAYVAAGNSNRLVVVDVSDPAAPVEVASVTSANLNTPTSVYVSGRHAYVATFSDRLTVVDVSNPAAPLEVGSVTSANLDGARSVYVSGRYAYVAALISARLVVVDVSDPTSPVEVGSVMSVNLDGASSVFASGRYAYVAAGSSDRLVVVDVVDPTAPVEKGSVTSANLNAALSVFVSGRYAYVAAETGDRLVVVDVTDPTAPVEKGSVTSANLNGAASVFVSGRYAYVAAFGSARLVVLEMDHLETPTIDAGTVQAGSLQVNDNAIVNNDLHVRGGLNVGPGGALIQGDLTVNGTTNAAEKLRVLGDVRVGTSGTNGCVKDFGGTALTGTCASDEAYKRDIEPFGPVLEKLAALQPSTWTWRANEYPELQLGSERTYGLIAQQVEQYLPELVATDEQGRKSIHYHLLPLFLAQGVRELAAENDTLREQLGAQQAMHEAELADVQSRLAALERAIGMGQFALQAQR